MNATQVPACMGGWCKSRQHCAMYHHDSQETDERMCPKHDEKPVPIHWPALAPESHPLEAT